MSGATSKILLAAVIVALCVAGYMVYTQVMEPEQTPPTHSSTAGSDTVTDVEGNIYETIKIGDQVWMAENLKTTKYDDGADIPNVAGNSEWGGLITPAYCWLENDEANGETYGALYNWYAVDTGKLAPKGWHIPTEADWETLAKTLGGEAVAGGKMKEKGTAHWFSPNTGATNESGFNALPSSTRNYDGQTFYTLGDGCYFWASTEFNAANAWVRSLLCDSPGLKSFSAAKSYGRSIRCVKDP